MEARHNEIRILQKNERGMKYVWCVIIGQKDVMQILSLNETINQLTKLMMFVHMDMY